MEFISVLIIGIGFLLMLTTYENAKYGKRTKSDLVREECKGLNDEEIIVYMINKNISEQNGLYFQYGIKTDLEQEITSYPNIYERYNFHGGCLSCKNPSIETVKGCLDCKYFNIWDGEDKSNRK